MIKNMLNEKNIFIIILILFIVIMFVFVSYEIKLIIPKDKEMCIGIIDGQITIKVENVVYNRINEELKQKQHGDYMVEFAKKVNPSVKIEYFDATNENGIINTEKILEGLDYLKEKDVKIINLSLSTKKYSSDIQDWVNKNTDIKVYASYNNLENSYDYPAMYENVYGCGKKGKIKTKENDYMYTSNKIVLLNDIKNKYEGNSYLTIYTSIKEY